MKKTLLLATALMAVVLVVPGTVAAQQVPSIGLTNATRALERTTERPSLQQTAAMALLPTLQYAQTHNMPTLAEGMQDAQFIGAGLAYGSEIEKLGIQVMYLYFITAKLALGGDLTYFFPEKFDAFGVESKTNLIAFNVLARYLLYQTAALHAYAMGGLNLALFRFKTEGFGESVSNSESELGLALGGGLGYSLAFAILYVELSYVLGDADQLVVAGGLRFPLGAR